MIDPDPIIPEMPLAFDDEGNPVPVVEPAVYDPEPEADGDRGDLREAIGNFVEMLAGVGDAKLTGQVVQVLAFLAGRTPCRTKAELAARLKVSPGRISQILQAIPAEFRSLAELRNRGKNEAKL
jgi:hypothetical protein